MYEAWAAMANYKSASFLCTRPLFFTHPFLPRFSKLFPIFLETPFLHWRCSKGC